LVKYQSLLTTLFGCHCLTMLPIGPHVKLFLRQLWALNWSRVVPTPDRLQDTQLNHNVTRFSNYDVATLQ
jgi:hypothetical protein